MAEKKKTKKEESSKWYVINSYAGHDKNVVSEGKKRTVEEKFLPGYVMVKMVMNDDTWQIIRNTEGVTGFIGTTKKPTPLNQEEVDRIMAYMNIKQPAFQSNFSIGDAVKVVDGPFKDFVG